MEINKCPTLEEFLEIVEFIKKHSGEFTEKELWREFKKQKGESSE